MRRSPHTPDHIASEGAEPDVSKIADHQTAALIPEQLLQPGELIILMIKPSPLFILLVPLRPIMVIAVVIAVIFMMAFSTPISTFVHRHPTIKMLALSFLLLMLSLLSPSEQVYIPARVPLPPLLHK